MFYTALNNTVTNPVDDQHLLTLNKQWKNFRTKNWL
jgi:hypothetical protein